MLEQQLFNALSLGSVYALFALGFTLVFGVLGVINLSHGAVFMVGAYAALQAVLLLHWPLWAALAFAAACCGALGGLIDIVVLRPLRRRNAPHWQEFKAMRSFPTSQTRSQRHAPRPAIWLRTSPWFRPAP